MANNQNAILEEIFGKDITSVIELYACNRCRLFNCPQLSCHCGRDSIYCNMSVCDRHIECLTCGVPNYKAWHRIPTDTRICTSCSNGKQIYYRCGTPLNRMWGDMELFCTAHVNSMYGKCPSHF